MHVIYGPKVIVYSRPLYPLRFRDMLSAGGSVNNTNKQCNINSAPTEQIKLTLDLVFSKRKQRLGQLELQALITQRRPVTWPRSLRPIGFMEPCIVYNYIFHIISPYHKGSSMA